VLTVSQFPPAQWVREQLARETGAGADELATRLDGLAASFSRLRRGATTSRC
jgi:hypothetical protein